MAARDLKQASHTEKLLIFRQKISTAEVVTSLIVRLTSVSNCITFLRKTQLYLLLGWMPWGKVSMTTPSPVCLFIPTWVLSACGALRFLDSMCTDISGHCPYLWVPRAGTVPFIWYCFYSVVFEENLKKGKTVLLTKPIRPLNSTEFATPPWWKQNIPSAFRCIVSRGPMNAYRMPRPSDTTRSRSLGETIPSWMGKMGQHTDESSGKKIFLPSLFKLTLDYDPKILSKVL